MTGERVDTVERAQRPTRRHRVRPFPSARSGPAGAARPPYVATLAAAAGVLALSRLLPSARTMFPSDLPPLFARWEPLVGPEILLPVALGGVLVAGLPRLFRAGRAAFLVALVAFGFLFAVTLAVQSGRVRTIDGCCDPGGPAAILTAPMVRPTDYLANVPLMDRIGVREFDRRYAEMDRPALGLLTLHASTHPPGPLLLLWGLSHLFGNRVLPIALTVVLIGSAGVVPTYFVAGELYGERAARVAAVLFACSPAIALYVATSVDAVFMAVVALALAAVVRAPRSTGWAAAAGVLAGLALGFTWGATVLGPIGVGVGLLAMARHRQERARVALRGLVAAAALAAFVALLHPLLDLNLVSCFRQAVHVQLRYRTFEGRPYRYWVWGNLAAFLITVGIANTALVVAETRRRWAARRPGFETVLWAALVLGSTVGMFRGETDHIWQIFVPAFVSVAAAAIVRRHPGPEPGERTRGAEAPVAGTRGAAVAGLGQAVLTEALLFTNW
jgi:Dolichyl-phosphate-mannose-protein mannosyltransferase